MLAYFARMTRIHATLKPYLAALADEAVGAGLPLQRPLFLHHEDAPRAYEVWDVYLLGRDLLVAPPWQAGAETWTTYLPAGTGWVHLWTGRRFAGGGEADVDAPFGQLPVFCRRASPGTALFETLRTL